MPTEAAPPELPESWNHVQETITMLTLAVAQLEVSMVESDHSVTGLSNSFTNILEAVQRAPQAESQQLNDSLQMMASDVSQVVTDFQFYDRLAQRLTHIKTSLQNLSELLGQPNSLEEPAAWKALQKDLKSRYTMECEKMMFEKVLEGGSVAEAIDFYRQCHAREEAQHTSESGDIDLF